MKFAGNKYAYISKKKLENVNNLKSIKNDILEEKKEDIDVIEEENFESKISKDKRIRSRSRSLEKNCDDELDEVYSCDEEDNFGFIEKNLKKKKYDLTTKLNENKIYEHEIDTNILTINFEFLKEKVEYATGDPISCKNCEAIFNKFSIFKSIINSNETIWICEFCNFNNNIMIENEEIPLSDCVDYFVQSRNQLNNSLKNISYNSDQSIIYCFDISGSMCVSSPISGKHKLKGDYMDKYMKDLMSFSDGSDQFYGNNNNVTYISRLQCLQAAIESNITDLYKAAPNMKIGYVVFNNEVTCFGDGTKQPFVINGNNLNNYNEIIKLSESNQSLINSPIKDSYENLIKQLYNIEESGQTALGPAVLFSINLIKGISPGSKLILCTDGISNMGLGAIEGVTDENELEKLSTFYMQLGIMAKEKGIVINLITFEDSESKIEILMPMIDQTGGEIVRVKPSEILGEFSNLLTTEVIASNVKIKVKLHKVMQFRNEDSSFLKDNASTLLKEIGNATRETELYVEYSIKNSQEIAELNDIDLNNLKRVPFQAIIDYTNKFGDRCIRVTTSNQEISSDKELIEEQALFDIISTNAIKKTSSLAEEGRYREAQSNALAWKKMMKKNNEKCENAKLNYDLFSNNMTSFNNNIQQLQYNNIMINNGIINFKIGITSLNSKFNKRDDLSQQIHTFKNLSQAKSYSIYNKSKKPEKK